MVILQVNLSSTYGKGPTVLLFFQSELTITSLVLCYAVHTCRIIIYRMRVFMIKIASLCPSMCRAYGHVLYIIFHYYVKFILPNGIVR